MPGYAIIERASMKPYNPDGIAPYENRRGIAATIGKVDRITGEVTEDFRSEVLRFMGTALNYNDLYKEALVSSDYNRTEREIYKGSPLIGAEITGTSSYCEKMDGKKQQIFISMII